MVFQRGFSIYRLQSGIFVAFIITKIVNNKSEFDKKITAISEHINESSKLRKQLDSRYFEWYNRNIKDTDEWTLRCEVRDLFLKHKNFDPVFCYASLELSIYEEQEPLLKKISETIDCHRDEIEETEEPKIKPKKRDSCLAFDLTQPDLSTLRPDPELSRIRAEKDRKVEEEGEIIKGLILQVEYQAKKNQILLNQVRGNPESSRLVNVSIIAIIALFYVGVIYPLSFLPMDANSTIELSISSFCNILFSLKGTILLIISIVFNAIILVFLVANIRLKYSPETLMELDEYTKPGYYSVYISRRDQNLALLSKYSDKG